jgi:ATP-dependent DNA ligase
VKDGRVRLLTRAGLDWTDRIGTKLADALRALPVRGAVIDGELVVETNGASDFSALQAALSERRADRMHLAAHKRRLRQVEPVQIDEVEGGVEGVAGDPR